MNNMNQIKYMKRKIQIKNDKKKSEFIIQYTCEFLRLHLITKTNI